MAPRPCTDLSPRGTQRSPVRSEPRSCNPDPNGKSIPRDCRRRRCPNTVSAMAVRGPGTWRVLTGTDSIFCAGSDLTCGGDYVTDRGGEYGIIRRVRRKPLIAAVEGAALGGGLEIVLSCDLVVASQLARFGLDHQFARMRGTKTFLRHWRNQGPRFFWCPTDRHISVTNTMFG